MVLRSEILVNKNVLPTKEQALPGRETPMQLPELISAIALSHRYKYQHLWPANARPKEARDSLPPWVSVEMRPEMTGETRK